MIRAQFAYAQARLQARHSLRASATDWRRLSGSGDLDSFLHVAQRTPLHTWTQGLDCGHSSHEIERLLRQRLRDYVDEISDWLPGQWRAPLRWLKYLPDLPALHYLLANSTAPDWMLTDSVLCELAAAEPETRRALMQDIGLGALANSRRNETGMRDAWIDRWRLLWPDHDRDDQGLVYLIKTFNEYSDDRVGSTQVFDDSGFDSLISRLNYAFRRYSFQPGAACAHLALIGLDLQRLRGELVQRALFDEQARVTA